MRPVPLKKRETKPRKEPEIGVETVKVPAGKFRCLWTEVHVDTEHSRSTSRIWTSEEVPGLTVKIVSITRGRVVVTSTTELMEYKKK